MKKLVLIALLCALVLSLFISPAIASAESKSPYDLAESFAKSYTRRDVLSGGEGVAAKSLASYLTSLGYAVQTPSVSYTMQKTSGEKVSYEYSHVVGFSDRGKGKTILIGGYYGGFEPTDTYGVGEGASAALTVGALAYLAEAFTDLTCDYDISIAFWGGLEVGEFDVKKCGVDLDKLALYINLDCIAAGDKDYLYADDLPRAQESYFREIITATGAAIAEPPAYKKATGFVVGEGSYSYTHLGLLGANRFFMNEDIPCVSFLGGAWEYDCGLYRYAGKGEIEGSPLDTFDSLNEMNGGKEATEKRLLAACDVVIRGVTGEGLSEALAKAEKETSGADLDSELAFYLITFIGIAALIAFYVILMVKQGKDRRETVWKESFEAKDRSNDPYEELRSDVPLESPKEPAEKPPEILPPKDDDDVFRF